MFHCKLTTQSWQPCRKIFVQFLKVFRSVCRKKKFFMNEDFSSCEYRTLNSGWKTAKTQYFLKCFCSRMLCLKTFMWTRRMQLWQPYLKNCSKSFSLKVETDLHFSPNISFGHKQCNFHSRVVQIPLISRKKLNNFPQKVFAIVFPRKKNIFWTLKILKFC